MQTNKAKEGRILSHTKKLFLGYESTINPSKFYKKFPENISLNTEDKEVIGAFIYKPKSIDNKTQFFVFCHGKGCDRAMVGKTGSFERISNLYNACFIIIDYKGFADSTGDYTIEGTNYDVLAAYKYLLNHFNPSAISVIGHSLGAAVALEYGKFARKRGTDIPARIFCLAPFTSTIDICKDFRKIFSFFTFFIPGLENMIRKSFNYESIENAQRIKENLYIMHGKRDKVINIKHGRAIAEAGKCKLIETGHNHITIFTDEETWKTIIKLNVEKVPAREAKVSEGIEINEPCEEEEDIPQAI